MDAIKGRIPRRGAPRARAFFLGRVDIEELHLLAEIPSARLRAIRVGIRSANARLPSDTECRKLAAVWHTTPWAVYRAALSAARTGWLKRAEARGEGINDGRKGRTT
jgi:hypothetical protein